MIFGLTFHLNGSIGCGKMFPSKRTEHMQQQFTHYPNFSEAFLINGNFFTDMLPLVRAKCLMVRFMVELDLVLMITA